VRIRPKGIVGKVGRVKAARIIVTQSVKNAAIVKSKCKQQSKVVLSTIAEKFVICQYRKHTNQKAPSFLIWFH
jgi:hypothetical protein